MKIRVVATTNHCLPLFLAKHGLDLKSVKFEDFRVSEAGLKEIVVVGDGRYVKRVLRSISSCHPRSDFDWSIL